MFRMYPRCLKHLNWYVTRFLLMTGRPIRGTRKLVYDLFTRILIGYLDGSNSLDDLCQIMSEQVDKGVLVVQVDGKDIADAKQRRLVIRNLTESALSSIAKHALLVA